jgi:seryl-tRNA synthetase
MEALRVEADESSARAEEYKAKIKQLESETTQKEQEITSLTHKNSVLESEVEKLEGQVKVHKDEAGAGAQAGTQAESLQRKIQVLEEEAEESDRTIRELNEKYVPLFSLLFCFTTYHLPSSAPDLQPLTRHLQAPPNRRQVRPLRTQSPSPRAVPRPVGNQVRRDGQEIRRHQEGARRLCQGDR